MNKPSSILLVLVLALSSSGGAAELPAKARAFLDAHCIECHDAETKKGDLDLTALKFDLDHTRTFFDWAKVHERVESSEMPPAKKRQPSAAERTAFLDALMTPLVQHERDRQDREGRAAVRRLNRTEYEHTLRDLLALPELRVADALPPEGSAHGFDKSAEALDFSPVHAERLMEVADAALRRAIATVPAPPAAQTVRFECRGIENIKTGLNGFHAMLKQTDAMPLNGLQPDTTWRIVRGDFKKRDPGSFTDLAPLFDGVAVFANGHFNLQMTVKALRPTVAGRYKLRLRGFGVLNDHGKLVPTDLPQTVSFYSHERLLGMLDVPPYQPTTAEMEIWLEADDVVKTLVASAPFSKVQVGLKAKPGMELKEPPAYTHFKAHGVAYQWMELEGPLPDAWPPASHRRLFGDLPLRAAADPAPAPAKKGGKKSATKLPAPAGAGELEVVSRQPEADAARLLQDFLQAALRRPMNASDLATPLKVVTDKLKRGESFLESMVAGYRAVLTSPDFLLLRGAPGKLDAHALAERLSYFLWDTQPDARLRAKADDGSLRRDDVLRAEVERLLDDPRAQRFVAHFLDKWLKLEDIALTEPDENLYPDYNPLLQDSALAESRAYFTEMLRQNLGARHVIASDFVLVNQRLAELYGIAGVRGNELRQVALAPGSVRGGFLTQAAVLKTTANGTTTSPVVRGAYVMTHLLGDPPPPPPPVVPAVEPDITGATTIRQQLDKHRAEASCAACHAKIDPPGFALESFDVMGGFRERYRSIEQGDLLGLQVDGKPAKTRAALPVDASGELPTGERFRDIHEFRRLLLAREDQIARHLLEQLITYATGAPVGFADRPELEKLFAESRRQTHGVRGMIHLVTQSGLFRHK